MTASGLLFYPLDPRAEDVRIEDIAHGLAGTNRFQGHTRWPYSVAQHSVLVSVVMTNGGSDPVRGLYGLLHDASEFVLTDLPRPLKRQPAFAAYREAEARLQALIYTACELSPTEPSDLKVIDRQMLRTEQAALMPPPAPGEVRTDQPIFHDVVIERWTFEQARAAFLTRFQTLQRARARLTG